MLAARTVVLVLVGAIPHLERNEAVTTDHPTLMRYAVQEQYGVAEAKVVSLEAEVLE